MSNKKTSRIDIIGQNGNDGLHYDVLDEYQQINNIDDVILTQAWYDALNEDDEDAK